MVLSSKRPVTGRETRRTKMKKKQMELVAVLARETSLNLPALCAFTSRLNRLAAQHKRVQEARCNYGDTDLLLKKEAAVEKKINQLVKLVPEVVGVSFQGDPRGFTVKLQLKSGITNDWGREGWGV